MTNDQIALLASGASAAIALLSLAWSIWAHRDLSHPKLKVSARNGFRYIASPHSWTPTVSVAVANVGSVPLTIRRLSFRLPRERDRMHPREWLEASLPRKLEAGDCWDAPILLREAVQEPLIEHYADRRNHRGRWRIEVVVEDAADGEFIDSLEIQGPKARGADA